MIVGGSIMLLAMAQQIDTADKPAPVVAAKPIATSQPSAPLTTDLATEKRLLAQKQQARAARIAEQEKRAKELLAEQENAEAEALAKSKSENQRYVDKVKAAKAQAENELQEATQKSTPEPKDGQAQKTATTASKQDADKKAEQITAADNMNKKDKKASEKKEAEAAKAAPKSASTYSIQSGDNLGKLAEKYHVPLSALTQANGISKESTLKVGQKLTIPSKSQITKLQQDAKAAKKAEDDKRRAEEAQAKKSADIEKRLTDARKTVKETDAKGTFGVQVALATSQANADEVVKKLKAAGYEVKTSKTDRGVRVMVGPERGKIAALALKDKINHDPNVKTDSAWVLYWR